MHFSHSALLLNLLLTVTLPSLVHLAATIKKPFLYQPNCYNSSQFSKRGSVHVCFYCLFFFFMKLEENFLLHFFTASDLHRPKLAAAAVGKTILLLLFGVLKQKLIKIFFRRILFPFSLPKSWSCRDEPFFSFISIDV